MKAKTRNFILLTVIMFVLLFPLVSSTKILGFKELRYDGALLINSSTLSIRTSDIERLFVGSNGNIGIGTSNPAVNLVVVGSVNINSNLNVSGDVYATSFVGDSSGLTGLDFSDIADFNANLTAVNTSISLWNVSGTNIFQRDLASNVGIGSDNPAVALVVVGSVNITSNLNVSGDVYATSFVGDGSGLTGLSSDPDTADFNANLTVVNTSISQWNVSGNDIFNRDFKGNVGVGTVSPQGRLSVSNTSISLTWTQIGTNFNIAGAGTPFLAALSPNRVAFIDAGNKDLRVYEFDGTSWSQIGNELAITDGGSSAITALSPNSIAYIDSVQDDLRVYEFDGTSWSQIGSDFNIASVSTVALTALSPNRVAFADISNQDLRVYEFDGSTWLQIGSDLNIASMSTPALAALSSNRIAFIDWGNADLRTYEFDGSTWSQIGSDLNIPGSSFPVLAKLSPNRVAFFGNGDDDLRVYEFDGSTWYQIGPNLNIAGAANPALAALSPNRVVFIHSTPDDLQVYQFSEPLFFVAGDNDFPFFAVSDNGYTTAEALYVRTDLRVGQEDNNTMATGAPSNS